MCSGRKIPPLLSILPWAGQDCIQTAPAIAVNALKLGSDKSFMAAKPGEVMGYLAFGHSFLDGNGRTIMVVHAELAERAGF